MSQIEMVFGFSKKLEGLLTERYGAEGKGLHEKVTFAEASIAPDIVSAIRKVATIRNKTAHEPEYVLDDIVGFRHAAETAIVALGGTLDNEVVEESGTVKEKIKIKKQEIAIIFMSGRISEARQISKTEGYVADGYGAVKTKNSQYAWIQTPEGTERKVILPNDFEFRKGHQIKIALAKDGVAGATNMTTGLSYRNPHIAKKPNIAFLLIETAVALTIGLLFFIIFSVQAISSLNGPYAAAVAIALFFLFIKWPLMVHKKYKKRKKIYNTMELNFFKS